MNKLIRKQLTHVVTPIKQEYKKASEPLYHVLEKQNWKCIWGDNVFKSPCGKWIIKYGTSLYYTKQKEIAPIYVPTLVCRVDGHELLVQPFCKNVGSVNVMNRVCDRVARLFFKKKTVKWLRDAVREIAECDITNMPREQLVDLAIKQGIIHEHVPNDIHGGNVGIWRGKPVLHDW